MKRRSRIALVEVPAVVVEMRGNILGEVLLNHPKYSQLLLAANLRLQRALPVEFDIEMIDMKALGPCHLEEYRKIEYEGQKLSFLRAGVLFETVEECLITSDIIGMTANYTFERSMVTQTMRLIREKKGKALVVVGGHDATADPRYYLQQGADICVLGEGETALQDIAIAMEENRLSSVRGIAFLDNGKVRKNGKRPNHLFEQIAFPDAQLLETIHFDQCPDGPFPSGVDSTITVMETSRGCNERCSFCDSSFIVGRYRPIALQLLLARIEVMKQAGIRTILFADDNLLYRILPEYGGARGRKELLTLFEAFFENGFAWTFYNGLQFGLLENKGAIDTELIDTLFRNDFNDGKFTGCFRAYIPLEKFTQEEMVHLPKLRSLEIEQMILSAIAQKGVPELNLGFIIANPRETPKSLEETIFLAKQFGKLVLQASNGRTLPRFFPWCSVPIPGTPDHKYFAANIAYPATDYPELYSNYTSVLRNGFFSPLDFTLERQRIDEELNGERKALNTISLS